MAVAYCTVPIRMLVYLSSVTVTLLTQSRRRPDHDVGIEQRQDAAMTYRLIAEQVRERRTERPVHFANCDFGFCGGSRRSAGDKSLSDANANSTCSLQLIFCRHR